MTIRVNMCGVLFGAISLFATSLCAQVASNPAFTPITPALFSQFVDMRVGTGEPVYWYCIGEVYEYPSGKLVAKVEGIDTARLIPAESTETKKITAIA